MSLRQRLVAVAVAVGLSVASFAASPATAAPTHPTTVQQASDYIAAEAKAGKITKSGDVANAILALAASQSHQDVTLNLLATLKKQAADYADENAGGAGLLMIVADTMGVDPTNFGGANLPAVVKSEFAVDPDLEYFFKFGLAVIGMQRAGQPIPDAMVTRLFDYQFADGGFGFAFDGKQTSSPDETAIGIMALSHLPKSEARDAALSKAFTWAEKNKTAQGFWTNYSPANTTGLMASAYLDGGREPTAAINWLVAQQKLTKKGWSNTLNGTESNVMATVQALLPVAGVGLYTVTFVPAAQPTTKPTTSATATATATATESTSATASASATASPSATAPAKPGLPHTGADGDGPAIILGLGVLLTASAAAAKALA